MIQDRETGRSRGFGFVTFSSPDSARDAIQGMNDSSLDGRTIKVNAMDVMHLRDGKVVEVWAIPSDQYAYDEFVG